jgi:hypothetical protein
MTVDSTHKDTKAEGEGETDSQLERGHKELLALFNAAIGAIRQNKEYQWKEFNASMLGQSDSLRSSSIKGNRKNLHRRQLAG